MIRPPVKLFVIGALFSGALAGCASTAPIEQARDVSTSGLAYTTTLDQLLDVTIAQSIDFNTSSLVKARRNMPPAVLDEILSSNNEAVLALVSEIHTFQRHNALLAAYFLNLQALAESEVANDIGSSVEALSASISSLNETRDAQALLTSEQATQIGALGGLAARSVQAGKLKNAMERDAEVIALQLTLHENQLANLRGILADQFDAESALFYNEEVRGPFVDFEGAASLPGDWRSKREQYLRTSFVSEQLVAAEQAARQLRGVWTDIVQGGNDIGSLRVLLSDIREFVAVSTAVRDSFDGQ